MVKEAETQSVLQKKIRNTDAALTSFDAIVESQGRSLFAGTIRRAQVDNRNLTDVILEVGERRKKVVDAINDRLKTKMEAQKSYLQSVEAASIRLQQLAAGGFISQEELLLINGIVSNTADSDSKPGKQFESKDESPQESTPKETLHKQEVVIQPTEISVSGNSREDSGSGLTTSVYGSGYSQEVIPPQLESSLNNRESDELSSAPDEKAEIASELFEIFKTTRFRGPEFRVARTILSHIETGIGENRLSEILSERYNFILSPAEIRSTIPDINSRFIRIGAAIEIAELSEEVEGQMRTYYIYSRPSQTQDSTEPNEIKPPPVYVDHIPTLEELTNMLSPNQKRILEQLPAEGIPVDLSNLYETLYGSSPTKNRINSLVDQINQLSPIIGHRNQRIIFETEGKNTVSFKVVSKDADEDPNKMLRPAPQPKVEQIRPIYAVAQAPQLEEMDEKAKKEVLDRAGLDILHIVVSGLTHAIPAKGEQEIGKLTRDLIELLPATTVSREQSTRALASKTPEEKKRELLKHVIERLEFSWSRTGRPNNNQGREESVIDTCLTLINSGLTLERTVAIICAHFNAEPPKKYSTAPNQAGSNSHR